MFDNIPVQFEQEEVSIKGIQEAFKEDREQELVRPAVIGNSSIRFKLLHKAGMGVRRIFSMLHALHDGVRLGHLARDLSALYCGIKLPKAPSFVNYLDHRLFHEGSGREY